MGLRNKSMSFIANDLGISNAYMEMDQKAKKYRSMKRIDDNYIPPKDSELGKKENKGPKVVWDNKRNEFVLA